MMGAQINIIARNIAELNDSFYEIQLVFDQYQDVISEAQSKLNNFRENLQTGITVTAWIFTIIFIWLGIAQLGLLTQGLERVNFRSGEGTQISDGSLDKELSSDGNEDPAVET